MLVPFWLVSCSRRNALAGIDTTGTELSEDDLYSVSGCSPAYVSSAHIKAFLLCFIGQHVFTMQGLLLMILICLLVFPGRYQQWREHCHQGGFQAHEHHWRQEHSDKGGCGDRARGRHDPCVVPRAVPMVEIMVAMVLAD